MNLLPLEFSAQETPASVAVPALQVDRVSHSYGNRVALSDVSFAVPQGGFTALLGLNGAGKSTLFSLITRLYETRRGHISVLGVPLARATASSSTTASSLTLGTKFTWYSAPR